MANKVKQVWVSPNSGNGWKVKVSGNSRASALTSTKLEAEQIARRIAINNKSETKIQRMDGTIQGGNSYGKDPYPPKDKNIK